MENASKALIIAGAILLSILIISLGIMIFNQAQGVVNNNAMTEVEISSFNQKFTQYEGTKVRGSNVNALLNAVVQNNLSQDDESKKVTVNNNSSSTIKITKEATSVGTKAATGSTYNVKMNYDTKGSGLITDITINENTK